MIVVDIETSGSDRVKCGIWQIGAINLNNPKDYFLQEARIDERDIIEDRILEKSGKTKKELMDKKKQSEKQLLINFFEWIEEKPMKNFLCQNPAFDFVFLNIKSKKYDLIMPVHYRNFDLHSIAQTKYYELNKKFLVNDDTLENKGEFLVKGIHSEMGLSNILKLCGMRDNRKEHNALEDAKLTGECFFRLMYGQNLFPEYAKFKIPRELTK